MTVKISGVLKDGTGKPVQNCTIVLKARRTSSTVVVNTVASENPDEAGRYSMDVEHGQYSVTLLVEGFPPSHAGTITVYEGSRPGTLNDFLGAIPSARKVNGKALSADITLTPKDIGTLNSTTMSFSGGAGWFKLATVTMPQASSVVSITLIGGAGFNVGSPQQAGISELVLRAGNGNPKGITHSLSGTAASSGAHAHTVGIGAHTHSVAIGSHGHTITVNAAGNAENTVKNIAFNYIVRLA
ncbi:hypothetical protein B9S95_004302 [Escherichia coli]|nr:hypothetical protein [Escherichia coli]